MAKRKKKRLAGFGLTKAEHQHYATLNAVVARNALKAVRTALNRGDCKAAVGTLADAGFYAGRMAAHSSSRSLIIKNRRPRGKGSVGGAGVSALRQVVSRVIRACAK